MCVKHAETTFFVQVFRCTFNMMAGFLFCILMLTAVYVQISVCIIMHFLGLVGFVRG